MSDPTPPRDPATAATGRATRAPRWLSRGTIGIVAATFFSDVGHEMVTAIVPAYLASLGLGATALGLMEGIADLAFSLSKLAGGWVGHHARRKQPWAASGYALTTFATGALALVGSATALVAVRSVAWLGRGFRSPLRDFLLADEVGPAHFGRAYGLERAADMLGAVAGPLLALALLATGLDPHGIIALSLVPSLLSLASFVALVRDREASADAPARGTVRLPGMFWLFVAGVLLFGLGDFSRTFLILLAVQASEGAVTHAVPIAVLLYAMHNAVSAVAALGAGRLADRRPKGLVLTAGYVLGAGTNLVLASASHSLAALALAVVLSGVYIAIEETVEKAAAAEMLPREVRSLGLGILATANAVGDMASSLYVGVLLDRGRPGVAFGIAAGLGVAGALWTGIVARRVTRHPSPA